MAKNQPAEKSINLSMRQKQVEHTTAVWRAARDAKFKADQAFEDAEEKREEAIILLNQDIAALKSTCGIVEGTN